MRVRALETGYDNVAVREPGDEFEMPEGSSAHWFEPVNAKTDQARIEQITHPKGKHSDLA